MATVHSMKVRKGINKAYLKVKPNRSDIDVFKLNLIQLLDHTNEVESEEFHKNLVADFLKKTYYDPHHFINTKGRNDLVIHNGKAPESTVGVIIEAKKPTNKAEMLNKDNINYKAFHELILYYLRERIAKKNLEIKYLVVTNIYEWFVFDASVFEKLFAQNKGLVKQFEDFEAGRLTGTNTDFFYNEIAKPFVAQLTKDVEFTYVDLRKYEKPLRNNDKKDDAKLIALFKLFSPEHLLKLPFANDSNSLDKKFYTELLHLIGLEETKDKGKKVIGRSSKANRKSGTLLENTINQLESLDKLNRLSNPSQYGSDKEERLFNVGLELCITWVNRILFLKLLEAQLVTYHGGDSSYSFLNLKRIKDFDELNTLFFQVLARKHDERSEEISAAFGKVPYLNSSLFEPTELEHQMLFISNLRDGRTIPIHSNTVLKSDTGKKRTGELDSIEYLFSFLDAYDFSSEGSEDIQEDNKTLINASVLGLIFEKINGYKDGSFFTPGFITMYMCRETIRRAVVQKFNEAKGWNCETLDDLYDKIENRNEANELVNSIKICDPAVGSGHFLVSALNEIISIKNDLRILQDREGNRLKEYVMEVVNDELIVTDDDGELFEYHYASKESQRVQEALFHEKQTIIENCLFGVDINPNSVKICRLRLWIELLKSAYYKNETELETLPNIDINIKCGNSLISRFALDADLKDALKKSKWSIDSYRVAVDTYRNAENKEQKREMERLIEDIKNDFRSEIHKRDPKMKQLNKLSGELVRETTQQGMFGMTPKQKKEWKTKTDKLSTQIQKLESEIEEIKSNKIYENAFEWRFEFPEVLNDKGDFVGFDVVIGNPPYLLIQNLPDKSIIQFYNQVYISAKYKPDLFALFIEKATKIQRINGLLSFIVPYTWLSIDQHKPVREILLNLRLTVIIDLPQKIFESSDLDTTIFISEKKKCLDKISIGEVVIDRINITRKILIDNIKQSEDLKISLNISDKDFNILKKIQTAGEELGKKFEVSQGYIPYRRADLIKRYGKKKGDEIVDKRLWHSDSKINGNYKQEIQGRDLRRFTHGLSNQYVKYGKHVAGYVAEKFFKEPRILIMEVTRGDFYKITASYSEIELYNTPSIINIIEPTNDKKKLITLLGLLNSRLYSWYHYKMHSKAQAKTSIPKILVKEVRTLPIHIDLPPYFIINVNQILTLKKENPEADTSALEAEIDQMVYKLYGLTKEEIKIIEESVG